MSRFIRRTPRVVVAAIMSLALSSAPIAVPGAVAEEGIVPVGPARESVPLGQLTGNRQVPTNSRAQAAGLYRAVMTRNPARGQEITDSGCPQPQRLDAATIRNLLALHNAYRAFNHTSPVTLIDSSDSIWRAEQAGAVMHAVDYLHSGGRELRLTHSPDSSWLCATDEAIRGVSTSTLSTSASDANNLPQLLQVKIADDDLPDPGHRVQLLSPRLAATAYGLASAPSSDGTYYSFLAAHTLSNGVYQQDDAGQIVAWPAAGYFPQELLNFRTWSIYVPNLPAGKAFPVTITGADGTVIHRTATRSAYAASTLIFEAPFRYGSSYAESAYQVAIDLGGGDSVQYSVTPFTADPTGDIGRNPKYDPRPGTTGGNGVVTNDLSGASRQANSSDPMSLLPLLVTLAMFAVQYGPLIARLLPPPPAR
ncbi:hypothetical protein ACFPVT_01745 [Corynebacterium choanae]|uniref:hypothetical protein n=1 Tax=Corynebacterium choanae TaxID=1862358 RepID=UPI000F4F7B0B|nr:hypothetical protein [Corynebacterium choanae]